MFLGWMLKYSGAPSTVISSRCQLSPRQWGPPLTAAGFRFLKHSSASEASLKLAPA